MQSRSKRLDLVRCTPLDATAEILMKTIFVLEMGCNVGRRNDPSHLQHIIVNRPAAKGKGRGWKMLPGRGELRCDHGRARQQATPVLKARTACRFEEEKKTSCRLGEWNLLQCSAVRR